VTAAGAVLVGCGGGSSAPATSAATDPVAAYRPVACHRPLAAPVTATPVPGVSSDWTVTSFDGTLIRAHWFPVAGATPSHPAPTVFMGPGWSESGDTDLSGTGDLFGTLSIPALHRAGFNVLTWDPRGFGKSTGTVEVDSPDYEARDVSRLIDWVSTRPGVELDAPGDPRMGMVGGSYGGGIQWVTAAQDCRVDAITPTISWHSLTTSLDKTGIAKTGWGNLLLDAAAGDSLDPHIRSASASGNATGQVGAADAAWFAARGPASLVAQVHVPTLIVQGTVDTLFTLDEGITNYRQVRHDGVPVSMLWYCGGHGVCLTNQGNPTTVERATIAWLERWVTRDAAVSTGPRVDLIDQHGVRYAAADYPLPSGGALRGTGSGTLSLVATGGSGPFHESSNQPGASSALAGAAFSILPARAANAVDVAVHAGGHRSLVVGAPLLSLTYRGTTGSGPRPTRVFAQLVDDSTGLVVGSQVTPVALTLDGATHTTTTPLEVISHSMASGQTLTLQLVATTVAYAQPQLGGTVDFSHVGVSLPVVAPSSVHVSTQP
jgi:ABC-2 type transport system ATP-binding protein